MTVMRLEVCYRYEADSTNTAEVMTSAEDVLRVLRTVTIPVDVCLVV